MQLSKRLKAITEFVTPKCTVADIGCDHAYISIYLIENRIAEHVVAMDINKGPLQRAKENIDRYGYHQYIETRLSDGAKELKPAEVDTLLIAGMGGALTVKILSDSLPTTAACKELVLQPQSEVYLVRQYLHQIGYQITKENMLIDDGKNYVVIKANKGTEKYDHPALYYYGKLLLEAKNEVLKEFLQKEKNKLKKIIRTLKIEDSDRSNARLVELEEELKYVEEGMKYYGL